jgi:hypothetical protein
MSTMVGEFHSTGITGRYINHQIWTSSLGLDYGCCPYSEQATWEWNNGGGGDGFSLNIKKRYRYNFLYRFPILILFLENKKQWVINKKNKIPVVYRTFKEISIVTDFILFKG